MLLMKLCASKLGQQVPISFFFIIISIGAKLVDRVGIDSKGNGARQTRHILLSIVMIFFFPFNLLK